MPIRGETIGTAFVRVIADGSGFGKGLRDELDDAEPAMEQAGEKSGKAYLKGFDDEIQRQGDPNTLIEAIHRGAGKFDAEGALVADGFLIGMREELKERFPNQIGSLISKNLEESFNAGRIDFDGLVRSLQNLRPEVAKAVKEMQALEEQMKGRHIRALREWNAEMLTVGDGIGRAFGKGSRNDFLNFFGAVVGKLATLPSLLSKVALGFVDFGQSISKAFTDAGGGVTGLIAASGRLTSSLGGAGIGAIGLGALVSTLATALLLAAGAALALASSLTFALVGAVAPLIGLLGPLSLVIGGVATAFIGMDKAAKKSVKETFKPLKEQLKALGDAARPGILAGFTAAVENLEEPMKRLKPLFKVVGESIGIFIDTLTKVQFGPGFREFVDVMSKTLPETMESLGVITGNVFDGLAGLFATLEPITARFLTSVEGITANFARWSISPSASQFFQNAAESASALLDFLNPVWDLTKQILDAGRGPGNDLFQSMGDAVQGWVDAINKDPNILRDFFNDAKKMGEEIGNVVLAFGHLIDAMDTPTTREWAIKLVEVIGDVINTIADLIGWFTDLDSSTQDWIVTIGLAAIAWGPVSSAIVGVIGKVALLAVEMQTVQGRTAVLATSLKFTAGVTGLGLLFDGITKADGAMSTFETTIGGALAGASKFGLPGAIVGGLAGLTVGIIKNWNGVEGAVDSARLAMLKSEGFENAEEDAASLSEALLGVINNYGNVTRAQIEADFFKEGELDKDIAKLRELGISMDTIVSGALGDPEAGAQIMNQLGTESEMTGRRIDELTEKLNNVTPGGLLVVEDAMGHLSTIEVSPEKIKAWERELAAANETGEDINATIATFEERIRANGVSIEEHAALVTTLRLQLGLTTKEYNNLSKPVRLDIESRGLPETVAGAERLIEKYRGLQSFRNIKAVVSAPGVNLTAKDVQRLAERYDFLPSQIKTLVKQEGIELTRAQLRKLIRDAQAADEADPEVEVGANTKPFDDEIEGVDKRRRTTDESTATPKIGADPKGFNKGNDGVNRALTTTNGKVATPKINVDASGAFATINSVTTALNNIADETVYINVVKKGGGDQASGGMFYSATNVRVGEAGPEAIVPLNRSLAQVDPAVRALSAFAQGLPIPGLQPKATVTGGVNMGGVTIITPTKDPGAVAQEVVNRLVATGYSS